MGDPIYHILDKIKKRYYETHQNRVMLINPYHKNMNIVSKGIHRQEIVKAKKELGWKANLSIEQIICKVTEEIRSTISF